MIIALCQAFNFYPSSSGVVISTEFIPAVEVEGIRARGGDPILLLITMFSFTEGGTGLQSAAEGGKEQTTHCRGHRESQHTTEEDFVEFAWLCLTQSPVWTLEITSVRDLRVKTSQDGFLENCHFILACIH